LTKLIIFDSSTRQECSCNADDQPFLADEFALLQQFVESEGNPQDTLITYAERVCLKALRRHIERMKIDRDEQNRKAISVLSPRN